MLIKVRVFPESGEESVIKRAEDTFEIWVKEKPVKGLANRAVINALAKHFQIPLEKIRLIKGFRESHKIFEIIK